MNSYADKYLQYAVFADDVFDGGLLERLSYVGLLGNGPANLPSGIQEDYYEEYYESSGEKKTYSGSYSHTYSYGFNSEGAINYATDNNSTKHYWSYDYGKSREGSGSPVTKAAADDNDMSAACHHALGFARLHRHHYVVE